MPEHSRPVTLSAPAMSSARLFLITLVCWIISVEAQAGIRFVRVTSSAELVAAIGDVGNPVHGDVDEVVILMAGGIYDLSKLPGSNLALPEITASGVRVTIRSETAGSVVTLVGGGPNSNYGLLSLRPTQNTDRSFVTLQDVTIRDFHTEGNGAVVSVDTNGHEFNRPVLAAAKLLNCKIEDVGAANGGVGHVTGEVASLLITDCTIERVAADENGGVLHATGGATARFLGNEVTDAVAGSQGGVLYANETFLMSAARNVIKRSHAFSQTGGHFYVNSERLFIESNQFEIAADSIGDLVLAVTTNDGQTEVFFDVSNNTFINMPSGGSGIFLLDGPPDGAAMLATLNLLHSNGGDCIAESPETGIIVESGGGNVSNDLDCRLFSNIFDVSAPDLPFEAGAPSLLFRFEPAEGNPAIDAFDDFPPPPRSTERIGNNVAAKKLLELDGAPCGYRDIRGLARPQDGDGDGLFGCDSGAYEVQGGADIGPAQSGAYFDLAHNGEGYFAEMIGNNFVFMAVFTFKGDGSGPAWYVGLGSVFGNSFVIDDLLLTQGGVFGQAFDATAITRTTVAGFSANFPTCEAVDSPGRWVIDPLDFADPLGAVSEEQLATMLEEQTQVNTRLSQIVPCTGSGVTASASAFRSGSYFDPARSGEGIFVQVLPNGQILVIWYTFDPQGNQMWIIAQGAFDGTTATIDALYPTSFTPFGSQFDPDQVVLSPWGTFTLSFVSCNSLEFSFEPTAPGYESGSLDYARLTQLAGTVCP